MWESGPQPGTGDETPPVGTGSIPYGPYLYLRRTGPNYGKAYSDAELRVSSKGVC